MSEVRILPGPPASLAPVPIATARLDLIPLDEDARAAIREGRGEGRAWADGYPTPGDLDVANLPAAPEPWTQYAIVERASGLTVGGAGFHREPIDGAVEIGYGLAPLARGRGIATEAVRAIVEVARAHGVTAILAETDDGNLASERVLERTGFERVGLEGGVTRWRHAPSAPTRRYDAPIMTITIGEAAPDFELLGSDWRGEAPPTFRLADALTRGGVVLHFFPAPYTSTCEAQMCAVRDDLAAYDGITVWGVTSHHPILIAKWEAEHGFGVPILADVDGAVSRSYAGLYGEEVWPGLRSTSRRAVVGIARDGVVRSLWIGASPGDAPSDADVTAAILAARG